MIKRPLIITGLLGAALLIGGCNQIIKSTDKPIFLSSNEIKQLFNNQTVDAHNLNTGVTSFTYYAPDGTARQERLWERRRGHWDIEKDRICLQLGKKPRKCRPIAMVNGRYYKYRPDKTGKLKPIVRYRKFIPGNILRL